MHQQRKELLFKYKDLVVEVFDENPGISFLMRGGYRVQLKTFAVLQSDRCITPKLGGYGEGGCGYTFTLVEALCLA